MVDNLSINPNILQRLKVHADNAGLSMNDLLEQWLDAPPQKETLLSSQSTGMSTTENKSTETALRESEARYRVLAENFPNGIVALYDHDLRYVVSHGEGAVVSASDLRGKRLRDVFPPDAYERDEPALLAALQGERRESTIEYQGQYFRVITVPVYDTNGNIINGMVMSQNINVIKQAELRQKELNNKLELAIKTAKLGIWELDIETDELTWNEQLHEIYGITPEEFSHHLADGLRYVHHDDQDEADRKFEKIYTDGFASDIKFRIIRPDGEVRYIQTSAQAIYDSHNMVVKLLGASLDVTQFEHTKHDLIEKESHLRSLVETSTAYIIRTDLTGCYTYVNPIFFEHFASHIYNNIDEIIGVSGLTHIAPEDHQKTVDVVELCLENVGKPYQVIIRKPSANGETVLTFWEFVTIQDESGSVNGLQSIGIDITEQNKTEQALEQSQANLEKILSSISDYVWSAEVDDGQFNYLYHSIAVEQITGYPVSHFMLEFEAWKNIIHPEDHSMMDKAIARELSGEIVKHEYRIIRSDGAIRWVVGHTTPTVDDSGQVIRFDGVVSDITERKLMENALRQSHANFEKTLSSISDYVWSAEVEDGQVRLLYCSPVIEKITGYPVSHFMADHNTWKSIIHPDDHHMTNKAIERELSGEIVKSEYRIIRSDGAIRWVAGHTTPTVDDSGQAVRLDGVVSDITERKLMEDALRQSQASFEKTLSSISDYIWSASVHGKQLTYLYYSPVVEQITGYPPEHFMDGIDAWLRIIHPDDRTIIDNGLIQELSGVRVEHEYRIIRADGSVRWLWGTVTSTLDDSGQVIRLDGVVGDITNRKLAENALRDSEIRYKTLFEGSLNPIIVGDENGYIVMLNKIAALNLGIKKSDAIGHLISDFFPDNYTAIQRMQDVLASGESLFVEDNIQLYDGQYWFLSIIQPVPTAKDQPRQVQVISYDITDRKQAENALRDSEIRYDALFEGSLNPIAIYDRAGRIVALNQVAALNMGVSVSDAIGRMIGEFFSDSKNVILERIEKVLSTGEPLYVEDNITLHDGLHWFWSVVQPVLDENNEPKHVQIVSYDITDRKRAEQAQHRTEERYRAAIDASLDAFYLMESVYDTDNNIIDFRIVEVNQNALAQVGMTYETLVGGLICELFPINREPEFFGAYVHVIETGETVVREFFVPPEAQASGWYLHQIVKVDDGIATITRNITEIKKQEQLQLENERIKAQFLKEQERNALIQRIISMLSHDLRTPLTIILSSQDMLRHYYDKLTVEKREEKRDVIENQVRFAIDLLQETVDLIRSGVSDNPLQLEQFNLASLCRISVEEFITVYGHSHHLKFVNLGNVQMVHANETLISRILLNLLSNAIKYTPTHGEIRLELDQKDKWIILKLIDNGMGISAEDLPHLFEPFFRTNNVTEIDGTGLGLSIVQDCVEQHQGRVYVDSELGQGTTFTVELPANIDM